MLPSRNRKRRPFARALTALSLLASLMSVSCSSPTSARIGEQFSLDEISYTVRSRKSQGQFVVPLIGEAIDAGHEATFVIVELEIINNGKRTSAIAASALELETPEGARYRPDVQGMAARTAIEEMSGKLPQNDALGAILRPRIPTRYAVVFRMPYRLARGNLSLIVHGPRSLLGGGKAVVALQ
jgi:hypothetical protein